MDGYYSDLWPDTYQVVAEISCPNDSNPNNNRREMTVTVIKPKTTAPDGTGSGQSR